MGIDDADDFLTDGALAILLPYNKAKFHSKMAEYDQLPRAVRMVLNDPRNVDTNFTAFDTISRQWGYRGKDGHTDGRPDRP